MKFAWLGCLLWSSLLTAGNPQSDMNVNTRYTVESVEFAGNGEARISAGLRKEILRLTGEKLNPANLDDLARRIRKELHVSSVSHHVLRGDNPEHVKVVFEITGPEVTKSQSRNSSITPSRAGAPLWKGPRK